MPASAHGCLRRQWWCETAHVDLIQHQQMISEIHSLLQTLANEERDRAVSTLPEAADERVSALLEVTRALDSRWLYHFCLPAEQRLSEPDMQILRWGWNLAVAHLLRTPSQPLSIPSHRQSVALSEYAEASLHQFGRVVLLTRSALMLHHGLLTGTLCENTIRLRRQRFTDGQYLDLAETEQLHALERMVEQGEQQGFQGWMLCDADKMTELLTKLGCYWGRSTSRPLNELRISNAHELMAPLVRPWESGSGTMVAYGADPNVDDHFLAIGMEHALVWRTEAGLHPDARLWGLTVAEITAVAAVLIALHIKHVNFVAVACRRFPQIDFQRSLTIWGPVAELATSISGYTNIPLATVKAAMNVLSAHVTDHSFFESHSTPCIPLLVDLGNGFLLRPVSSVIHNPFLGLVRLWEWRDSSVASVLAQPREEWFRSQLYALFCGNRYSCVDGNIKLRDARTVVTDVDAAIYDRTTGELALFQLKWQDYATNEVRQLRSKAKNLADELTVWGSRTGNWFKNRSSSEAAEALQLRLTAAGITQTYLFGLSRTRARTYGFGYEIACEELAVGVWPQFARIRTQTGPERKVLSRIHNQLREEQNRKLAQGPLSYQVGIADKLLVYEDVWTAEQSGTATSNHSFCAGPV